MRSYIILLLVSLSLASCSNKANEEEKESNLSEVAKERKTHFVGSWKIQKFKFVGKADVPPPPPQMIANSTFSFFKDGKFEINFDRFTTGKWEISPDGNYLLTIAEGKQKADTIDIKSASEDRIVLYNRFTPVPVRMELSPLE